MDLKPAAIVLIISGLAFGNAFNPGSDLQYFSITKASNIMEQPHVYCFSGNCTVNPILTGAGFGRIFSPPYSAGSFNAELKFFKQPTTPTNYIWYPSEFYADYGQIENVHIESILVPVAGKDAVVFAVKLTNNDSKSIKVPLELIPSGSIMKLASQDWDFGLLKESKTSKKYPKDGKVYLENKDGAAVCIGCTNPLELSDANTLTGEVRVDGKQVRIVFFVTAIGNVKEAGQAADDILADPQKHVDASRKSWSDRIAVVNQNVPEFVTDNADLKMFYDRGLLTILSCKWESSRFAANPWYAEAGIDGGAVCTYLWGYAYIDKFMAVMDPETLKKFILLFVNGDMLHHYAVTPLDGSGIGPYYAYNNYSLSAMLHSYVLITGDRAFLNQPFRGSTVLDQVSKVCLFGDDVKRPPVLINYGTNHNLLELRRNNDYQYYVPSPNAERCLIYRQLAEMYKLANVKEPVDFENRAQQLTALIRKSLWNSSAKWFDAIDTKGNHTIAYSIQIFDMLRTGVPDSDQAEGILTHLNDNEFLSKYGVHSLSKTDEGYDKTDVDWGGPGVYTGDAPELVRDLYVSGYPDKAADLLGRLLWWSRTMPYYPQAVYADAVNYRHDGRANSISGLGACQAIVFGVFGVDVLEDKIVVNPHPLPFAKRLQLKNLCIRGKCLDIAVVSEKDFLVKDGNSVHKSAIGTPVEVAF